jgi:hypothetical protein
MHHNYSIISKPEKKLLCAQMADTQTSDKSIDFSMEIKSGMTENFKYEDVEDDIPIRGAVKFSYHKKTKITKIKLIWKS